jgi:hypothetical protein
MRLLNQACNECLRQVPGSILQSLNPGVLASKHFVDGNSDLILFWFNLHKEQKFTKKNQPYLQAGFFVISCNYSKQCRDSSSTERAWLSLYQCPHWFQVVGVRGVHWYNSKTFLFCEKNRYYIFVGFFLHVVEHLSDHILIILIWIHFPKY